MNEKSPENVDGVEESKINKADSSQDIINNDGKNKKWSIILMQGSPFFIVGIFMMLIFGLFFLPLQTTQYLIIGINGEATNAQMGYAYVEEVNKPIINIFSPANPRNGFVFEINILNENQESVLSGILYNLGNGESIFKINVKVPTEENLEIITTLLYNNQVIDTQTFEGEVK